MSTDPELDLQPGFQWRSRTTGKIITVVSADDPHLWTRRVHVKPPRRSMLVDHLRSRYEPAGDSSSSPCGSGDSEPTGRRAISGQNGRDRGSASIEAVLLAPVVVALLCLIIAGGRVGMANTAVEGAARSAARAASLERSPRAATAAATTIGEASLATSGLECSSTDVTIDASGFTVPVGRAASLSVELVCVVSTSDLLVLGLPGEYRITKTVTVPLDTYRER